MRKMKPYHLMLAAALAAGTGSMLVPVLPAQAADKLESSEEIKADKVPAAAMATFQRVIPAGTKVNYHKQDRGKEIVYVAHYETAGGKPLKFHVNPDGSVFGGAEANPGVDLSPLGTAAVPAPVPLPPLVPAAGTTATVNFPPVTPAPIAALAASPAALEAQRVQVEADHARRVVELEQRNAEIDRLSGRIAELDRTAVTDRRAAAERDQLIAQRTAQVAGRDAQAVEISRNDQFMHEVEVRLHPQETAAIAGKLGDEQDDKSAGFHYTPASAVEVPGPAYAALLKFTKGSHGQFYRKEEQAGKISYSAHYLTPENKRYWASVYPDGKTRVEPRLSIYQPESTAGAAPAPTPVAGHGAPAHPAEQERAPDQKGDVKFTAIGQADVPAPALKAMEKYTKGNHDLSYRKESHADGKVTYSVHYVTPESKRMWVSIDPKGELEKGPLESTFQPEPKKTEAPKKTGK